jgi:ABC-type transport system substrate-binding protein
MGAAAAAGGVLMIGCGSDSDGGGDGGDASGLLSRPVDTTSNAKAGGTLIEVDTREAQTWDLATSTSAFNQGFVGGYAYPRMLKFQAAKYPEVAALEFEGDLAEKYEVAGDRMQVTFNLRQAKWDARTPTSGRVIDSQDVIFTWNKFSRLAAAAGNFVYRAENPVAPVEALQAPDSRTIIAKLHAPNFNTLPLFAHGAGFYIQPREAEGGFDPRNEIRGYGPFLLEEYVQAARIVWRKNPDYHVQGRPFVDRIERHILSEYAARHAQFRTGNIYAGSEVVSPEDIIRTKRDVPEILLRQGEEHSTSGTGTLNYAYERGSPFFDERVRQALSMLIDREAYADALTNSSSFKAEGIDVDLRYPSQLPPGYDGYWLDPRDDKAFGSNAKYLNYNPEEAKKLLTAAGHPNGFDVSFWFESGRFGGAYKQLAEILPQMWAAGGIRASSKPVPYAEYITHNQFTHIGGGPVAWDGLAIHQHSGAPTAPLMAYEEMHPAGRLFVGAPANGTDPLKGDPAATRLIEQMIGEFDVDKQQALAKEYQQLMAQKAYFLLPDISTPGFVMNWPVIGNFGVFRGPTGSSAVVESKIHWWIDDSKAPLKKA